MIFLGLLFPPEQEESLRQIVRNGYVQNQVNMFQWNLIDGMRENGVSPKILNCLTVGTFPKHCKKLLLPTRGWGENGENLEIGCINLPFFKQWQRYHKIKKEIQNAEDENIIIYSTYLPFLKAVQKIKKSVRVTLIITDLPEYYDLQKTCFFVKWLRTWNNKKIEKCLCRVDNYVLLTEQMKEKVPVEQRPYAVVEGICGKAPEYQEPTEKEKFIITYAGSLHAQFNIQSLVDAVAGLDENKYELHLFGAGDSEEFIKEMAKRHPNIVFHGFVTTNELNAFFQKTNLLVNPRGNEGDYTKYSFPSKTMEYLLSGIPFASCRLSGIPEEYYQYINAFDDSSAESIRAKIQEVADYYEAFVLRAKAGRDFVSREKNPKKQAEKVLKLLNILK